MTTVAHSPVFLFGLVIGIVLGIAQWIGGGPSWVVLVSAGIPIAYGALVTRLSRHSDSLGVLAGRPVDERAVQLEAEASTWALGITAIAVIVGVALQVAIGGDWVPYAMLAVVMAAAYVGSLVVLQARR